MKISFTSDLHLDSNKPERMKALDSILKASDSYAVELLIIGGDLFENREEAETLRPVLRDRFSDLGFDVIAIPGNHDYKAYSSELDFGKDIKILNKKTYFRLDYQDISIFALPYENQDFTEAALRLKNERKDKRYSLLVLHCSLDIGSIREDDFGEEKKELYLPVRSKTLGSLGLDYVFAGHFHSHMIEERISKDTYFYYSGSPVSVTKKEKGKRKILLLDTLKARDEAVVPVDIDSFYYDDIKMTFYPGDEDGILDRLKKRLSGYEDDDVELAISLDGLVGVPEAEVSRRIEQIIENTTDRSKYISRQRIGLSRSFIGIRQAYEDPLFKAFRKKLKEKDFDRESASKIEEIVLRQLSIIKCD